jgi:uncharacterized protein involved in response to NO
MMKFSAHPFWSVGFRPFFALAMLAGLSLPGLWAGIYSGAMAGPGLHCSTMQWHAHEMLFGFGWAVLGGFLLTATKNWVQVRGYHGQILMFMVAAWLFERLGMWSGQDWPRWLFLLSNNLFLGVIVAALIWTLIRHRDTDSYRDNFLFLLILPTFLLSKYLLLSEEYFRFGADMAIGLYRVAILVMLERTLSAFMKGAFQTEILRDPRLDMSIKLLALLLVAGSWLPAPLTAAVAGLLALLLGVRLIGWKPHLAWRRLDIGIMYLGYSGVVVQLLLESVRLAGGTGGALFTHVFTLGAMGLIIPAMLIRISRGHTGRKVVFDTRDKLVLHLMLLACAFRVIAPLIRPEHHILWITLAALCWFIGYALLGWRYLPWLWQPRVDGRAH